MFVDRLELDIHLMIFRGMDDRGSGGGGSFVALGGFYLGSIEEVLVTHLLRYRYNEAYQVDCNLQALEEDFISKSQKEEISFKIKSMTHWRKRLVDRGVELFPDFLQQQLKARSFPKLVVKIDQQYPIFETLKTQF